MGVLLPFTRLRFQEAIRPFFSLWCEAPSCITAGPPMSIRRRIGLGGGCVFVRSDLVEYILSSRLGLVVPGSFQIFTYRNGALNPVHSRLRKGLMSTYVVC